MLIVKDFKKLKKYGFIQNKGGVYECVIDNLQADVRLLVNAHGETPERLLLYFYWNNEENIDEYEAIFDLDIVFKMIKEGVIEYVSLNH